MTCKCGCVFSLFKMEVFYKLGFRVVIVWEFDWYTNPEYEIERVYNAMRESDGDQVGG